MAVGESVVNGHVFEVMTNMGFEKAFDFGEVEFRIYEDGTNVGFDDVGKTLHGCQDV